MKKKSINNRSKTYIPIRRQFPTLPKSKKATQIVEKSENVEELVMNNDNIDINQLALLVNICHVVADINEQFSLEISEILRHANPNLQLQFQRSIKQIRYHSADMVRFVDKHNSEQFSEGFGETADALKEVIMDFFRSKT